MATKTDVVAARTSSAVKVYGSGETEVTALRGVDVTFARQEFTAIMGPSGSGKSTLMHCLAGLDSLTSGQIFIGDTDLGSLNETQLTQLRRDQVGFVFQAFNLVPTLTAIENITLPADLAGRKADPSLIERIVGTMGLKDRLKHRPRELSGRPAATRRCGAGACRTGPTSSSPTSRPATSTPRRRPRSSSSCAARPPSSTRRL